MMTTFYIARHGQTVWNVEKKLQGHLDSALTPQGIAEAEQLRDDLAGVQFDQVFSSDSLRAARTAEIVALERNIEIHTTQLLREGNYGIFEGSTIHEFEQTLQHELEQLKHLTTEEHFKSKVHPSVESHEEMFTRVYSFIQEIAAAYSQQRILLLTHSGIIKSLLIRFGFGDYQTLPHGSIKNCAYLIAETNGQDFIIRDTFGIERVVG